jgi:hypothetical protein
MQRRICKNILVPDGLDHAFAKLGGELAAAGKKGQFAALKPWLVGDTAALSQADVAQTVPDAADVDAELRYLVEALAAGARVRSQ